MTAESTMRLTPARARRRRRAPLRRHAGARL